MNSPEMLNWTQWLLSVNTNWPTTITAWYSSWDDSSKHHSHSLPVWRALSSSLDNQQAVQIYWILNTSSAGTSASTNISTGSPTTLQYYSTAPIYYNITVQYQYITVLQYSTNTWYITILQYSTTHHHITILHFRLYHSLNYSEKINCMS